MIKIAFAKEKYELLKSVNLIGLGEHIGFLDDEYSIALDDEKIVRLDYFDKPYIMRPIEVLLDSISDEIVASGMTPNQERVLPRGKALYELYDGIYYNLQE